MNVWVVFENIQKEDDTVWTSDRAFPQLIAEAGHKPILVTAGETVAAFKNGAYAFTSAAHPEAVELPMPDCVVSRTGADTRKATFGLYNLFEQMDIPVINSSSAVALAADKIETAVKLAQAGLPIPDFVVAGPRARSDQIIDQLGLPVVAKLPNGTSGKSVFLLRSKRAVESFLHSQLESETDHDTGFKFQSYVEEAHGHDYRVLVIGDEAVSTVERRSTTKDFRANASLGGKMTPVTPPKEMEELAIAASKTLGLEIAGVDILMGKNGPLVCEVNSAPTWVRMQAATGLPLIQMKVDHILSLAENHWKRRERINAFDPSKLVHA